MILVYAVARGDVQIPRGLRSITRESLQCFYEAVEKPLTEATVQNEAVRFFNTNQQLYAQTDILEFRFPTLLSEEQNLIEFLENNGRKLAAELARLSDKAQITVYLPEAQKIERATTGTEYLRASRDRIVGRQQLVRMVLDLIGQDTIDCVEAGDQVLVLVSRARAADVIARVATLDTVRVAGPFPPSAFAKLLS